jgi:hypothetical protein
VSARRVEPTRSLLAGGPYKRAAETDLRATFRRIRAELKQPAAPTNVAPLKKRAAK